MFFNYCFVCICKRQFCFCIRNVECPVTFVCCFRWALPHMTTGPTYGLDDWFLSSPACIGVLIITAIASLSLSIILTKSKRYKGGAEYD